MKRPVSAVVLSMVILGIMAAPITNIKFSQGDSRMLPADNKAAFATALQAERFPGQTGTPIEIIIRDGANKLDEINTYAAKVGQVLGIVAVLPPQTIGNDVRVIAYQEMLPRTPESQELIHNVRNVDSPDGTLVGGVAADYTDSQWNFSHFAMGTCLDCAQRSSSYLYLYRVNHSSCQGRDSEFPFTGCNYGSAHVDFC
jgi:RND superfamily putative drug exporter